MINTWHKIAALLVKTLGGIALLLMAPHQAAAEEVEGLVRIVGSAMNTEVILTQNEQFSGPAVCYDELGKKVGRFAGMTVKVTGDEWKVRKNGEKKCFVAKSFTITKAQSGRAPVIGILTQKDGAFVVTGDDGSLHKLEDIPAGMKKLSGQKVIVDTKPMEKPAGKDSAFKVVTYGVYPQ